MENISGAYAPDRSTPTEGILARLEAVKPTGPNKWVARCPAHRDKTPSLAIKESADGTVLLKCWAGCSAADICAALDLELRDLFPGEKQPRNGPSKKAIEHEQLVYHIGVNTMMRGSRLDAHDQARFELAKQRLGVRQ